MVIHCVGDSHANFFSGFDEMQPDWPAPGIKNRYPELRSYRIGPVLAYKLCEYGTTSGGREKLDKLLALLKPGEHILFCFGEIDCRAHVLLQAEKQKLPPETIINHIVERYLSIILEIRQAGFLPLVWGVIPSAPTDINHRITVPPQYLFHGSCKERNRVSQAFNQTLKQRANAGHIPYLDIFESLWSEAGGVDRSFYSDEIHLSQKAMPLALEALKKVLPKDSFRGTLPADTTQVFYSTFT